MNEQITTDATEGKKADTEKPIKPVIWTDKEAGTRLLKKLYSSGTAKNEWWDANISNNSQLLEQALGYCLEIDNQTHDSLLHDLNIIKPIGRIEYTSDWIDKILSGQKTMDILPTQHACGYYELWDKDKSEVRGIVEIERVDRVTSDQILYLGYGKGDMPRFAKDSGFDSFDSFLDYHRTSFQSVKYAITYRVVDMKGDSE